MPSGSISESCSTGGIRSCASTSAAKRAPSRPNAARSLSRSCAWCHAKAHNGAGGYGLRGWIECGFKDGKRGGWNWQRCRSRQPERVERLWLAMAVATLITVGGGSRARSTRAAPLPGAGAVEAYCSPQRPSRPAAGRGGGQAVEGQAQTGPELFQSRLQAADASGLAIAREALLPPARRDLAACAWYDCGRGVVGQGIKKPTPKRGVERGGDPCGQYISIKRLSRFVILSASFGSLAGQRSKARAQDDTPASALFDSQTCLIEMY